MILATIFDSKKQWRKMAIVFALLCASTAMAQGSNTLSQGSAMLAEGSITVSEGASEVLAQAADSAVGFTVDAIETTGEIAHLTLSSSAQGSYKSTQVVVSLASATVASLALTAGSVIDIMNVYAENSHEVLGYLLLQSSQVLLFLPSDTSGLILSSKTL